MPSTLTMKEAADLFRTEPDRFLDVGAGEAAYRRVGTGPDVLFVHGWPVSGATYRTLLPFLSEHVTCHVVDLPGAGSSRFDDDTPLSVDNHIAGVQRIIDLLDLDDYSIVGHDSGGLIARHATAGDPRLRSMGLIDTEQPQGLSMRFKMFVSGRNVPGYKQVLGWVSGQRRLRRNGLIWGSVFADAALLDGEFDEFVLQKLHASPRHLDAAMKVLKSFEMKHVAALADLHKRIDVPVQMVWGEEDAFFPLDWAQEMAQAFPNASLDVVPGAGLFSHEERPAEVAELLLPTLIGR